tara:strand:- start:55218 stop:55871 length:654 start_codon:yes stop_codon:yes gene_type:complete
MDNVIKLNAKKKNDKESIFRQFTTDTLLASIESLMFTGVIYNWNNYCESDAPEGFPSSEFFELFGCISNILPMYLRRLIVNPRGSVLLCNFAMSEDKKQSSILIAVYNPKSPEVPVLQLEFIKCENYKPKVDSIPGRCRHRPIHYTVDGEKGDCPIGLGQLNLLINEMAVHSLDSDYQNEINREDVFGFKWANKYDDHYLETSVRLNKTVYTVIKQR